IIAIALIAAAFMKKDYTVQRDVVINQPESVVFEYIKYLKNQDQFSKWAQMDSNMKKSYEGTDGTVGFISKWEGNKDVGIGEQEIKNIVPNERIDFELRFKKPMESTSQAFMITEAVDSIHTKVTWGFSGRTPWPFNFMMAMMNFDKLLGADFEIGLDNLKNKLEQ